MTNLNTAIRVEVKTQYIEEQSSPTEEKYLFSYTVTIVNLGKKPAKLMTRHWVITDGNGQQSEVQGEGVVGETPVIEPDTAYQYTSGTMLDSPLGFMEGYYEMVIDNDESFHAAIPRFRLAVPGLLH